jgi:hypothetical protein
VSVADPRAVVERLAEVITVEVDAGPEIRQRACTWTI